jgi:hypothetical protein
MAAQVAVGPVIEGDTDDRDPEVAAAFEPVDGGEQLLLGEIARCAEHHEEVGSRCIGG